LSLEFCCPSVRIKPFWFIIIPWVMMHNILTHNRGASRYGIFSYLIVILNITAHCPDRRIKSH
jgi:hypothetical protein